MGSATPPIRPALPPEVSGPARAYPPAQPQAWMSARTAALVAGIVFVQALIIVALVVHFYQPPPAEQSTATGQPQQIGLPPLTGQPQPQMAAGTPPATETGIAPGTAPPAFPTVQPPAPVSAPPAQAPGYIPTPVAATPQPEAPPEATPDPGAPDPGAPAPDPRGWDSRSTGESFGRRRIYNGENLRQPPPQPEGWIPFDTSPLSPPSFPQEPDRTFRPRPSVTSVPVTRIPRPATRQNRAAASTYLYWLYSIDQERMWLEDSHRNSYTSLGGLGTEALERSPQPLQALSRQHADAKDQFWRNIRRARPAVPDELRSLDTMYMRAMADDQRATRALYRAASNLDANAFRSALDQIKETQADFASAHQILQQSRARYP